jgi:leucyl-tRNA synthetase
MVKYQPQQIESKWQKQWKETNLYGSNLDPQSLEQKKKFFVLAEFPYPSGDLHTGHWFTFCGADIYARMKRMQGFNVFFPNGFDAFGLPAENAAIKRGIHPKDWTLGNVEKMKEQFLSMGASFTFDHEVITCLPEYYKWNQWIFLKMFESGIAFRGKYLSNWCPNDQTVLANEGVVDGLCWRCGAQVVQKEVDQWFFKITDYADKLIWPEIPDVDWPKSVRDAQNDWIGKSSGVTLEFKVENSKSNIEVFTTRIDTIFGATVLILAPEHKLIAEITAPDQESKVKEYLDQASKKSELERKENKDKTGVFTGAYAINPFNQAKIPVWISDYVLSGYGTGAIMAVPAHDDRDFEFAKKFDLEIKPVIKSNSDQLPYLGEGVLINSGEYDGQDSSTAREKISKHIVGNQLGSETVTYHLHDWSISRQRYWGTPIPIVHCPNCGMVPVPDDQLPVELPYDVDFTPKGKSPLASNEEWLRVKCPKCNGEAERDPDTMDTFVDSSWYFFRYIDPKNDQAVFDKDLVSKVMPVDAYFGGAEHTLGHTLYSRFFTKFFKDLGLTEINEFAQRRIQHGVVLGPDGFRMSKSRGNVVNPDDEVKKYGADAVRTYLAFFMPYEGTGPWLSDRIWGPYRFLERVWSFQDKLEDCELSEEDKVMMNKTILKVGEDIDQIKFNTAVSAMMEWTNHLSKKAKISKIEYTSLLKLLSPFAPHITEEIWQLLGNSGSIHHQSWPEFDSSYLQGSIIVVVVQVNGKVRGEIEIDKNNAVDQKSLEDSLISDQRIQKFIDGKTVKKVVYVPGKVINFVIG